MAEDLNPILIQLLTRLKQSKEVEWWLTNQKFLFTVSLSALPGIPRCKGNVVILSPAKFSCSRVTTYLLLKAELGFENAVS